MKQLSLVETPLEAKVKIAIERFQFHEMFTKGEGYYLAFSGGKDSVVIKALADMAGVKYDAHYNLTTVDPPELVKFIKTFDDVEIHRPEISMWRLIEKNMVPPTRLMRYCCRELKEGGGVGRFVVTGVRWEESTSRKNKRNAVEFDTFGGKGKKDKKRREKFFMSDNDEKNRMFMECKVKGKHILNPIIDWTGEDIWEFIKQNDIPYCELYDKGWDRLGCIGCPMASNGETETQFEKYPKYRANYIKAFNRMLANRKKKGLQTKWKTGEDVMEWWLYGEKKGLKPLDGQIKII